MHDYLVTKKYDSKIQMNLTEQKQYKEILLKVSGINQIWTDSTSITIEFFTQLIDGSVMKETLESTGFLFKEKKKANFFNRFIGKLAKSNKKTFGDKKLDCCKLNN